MKLQVTADAVRETAAKHPESKPVLEALFPDAFEPEYFYFGHHHHITFENTGEPFFVGFGLAPEGLRGNCLIVGEGWDIEIKTIPQGNKIIVPFRKRG